MVSISTVKVSVKRSETIEPNTCEKEDFSLCAIYPQRQTSPNLGKTKFIAYVPNMAFTRLLIEGDSPSARNCKRHRKALAI